MVVVLLIPWLRCSIVGGDLVAGNVLIPVLLKPVCFRANWDFGIDMFLIAVT